LLIAPIPTERKAKRRTLKICLSILSFISPFHEFSFRRNTLETTRDYERYLAEMQQRIINRPLILERQSIIAQKQKFIRKYDERMASVGKIQRLQEYDSAEFENESGSSEKNKRSGSSISSSVGTSPTASHSKSSSSSNTKSSSSSKPKGLENGTS
uniref:Uncharacterized protein n=1 Tax=Angiostrongylus cantonensis TaxID=6313 RepID=A0A0K0DC73_ANGCA